MPHHPDARKHTLHRPHQILNGATLTNGTGILGQAIRTRSAFIANADTATVEPARMYAVHAKREILPHPPVSRNDKVIKRGLSISGM